ncbi:MULTISPECIES: Panacea domain-containing protein [unclassified Acinetobacter]|uniref:Panacea domain-containing protein n=1 Tax=unclassified Acinetobacter TaxID=196816 RepID=UPI002934E965|nr:MULTISPECIES: type II toxin-antitoxin system antitoxin SocA domain-containing protein [unclassified Acinetobacter]WOE32747.1 DUF4065 domain-containing protein [Acinetobacter sp. SAAs470]WOE38224.1 DUF4065 domain-containing protein [Acinetobacter sp. SAAs474]
MDNKKYTAMDIANYIVWYVNRNAENPLCELTPLKLQKILYYIASTYFKKTGTRLFSEHIQKWQYGPVVKEVYHEFKGFGFHHISKPKASLTICDSGTFSISRKEYDPLELSGDNEFTNIANKIISTYAPWKAFDLVELTHTEEAWKDFESDIMKGIELTYSDNELLSAKSVNV